MLRYLSGSLPVHVASAGWYAQPLGYGDGKLAPEPVSWHLTSLAHDLTVHAQNYQLVPHASIADLRERIIAAMPQRHAAWQQPGGAAPLTMSFFLDNDLNRYCYAVWCRCQSPSEFGARFREERNYRQLLGALERRIAETLAGKGDAPSGRTEDMPPLEPVEFRIT
jgi:hypothetical protein